MNEQTIVFGGPSQNTGGAATAAAEGDAGILTARALPDNLHLLGDNAPQSQPEASVKPLTRGAEALAIAAVLMAVLSVVFLIISKRKKK